MSKVAFLFPGQGAQSLGMGKQLYDSMSAAKAMFDRAADVLGYDLSDVCFNGPVDKLNSTVVSQPALYVTSMIAVEKLRLESPEKIEQCTAAAGLSLGEYSAIAFTGGLSFEDGLRLVQKRGEAMQAAADQTPSGMVSILGLDQDAVEQVCDAARLDGEILQVANILCPGNIAVSGHQASCENVVDVAKQAGAKMCVPLAVAGAFHTPIMEPAVSQLAEALSNTGFKSATMPVHSNVDARPHTEPADFRRLLQEQVCSPVLWNQTMHNLLQQGYDEFYEVGWGKVLKGLLKRVDRKLPCHGVMS